MWPSGSLQVGSTVFDVSNTWILLDQRPLLTIWSEAKELIYNFFQFGLASYKLESCAICMCTNYCITAFTYGGCLSTSEWYVMEGATVCS